MADQIVGEDIKERSGRYIIAARGESSLAEGLTGPSIVRCDSWGIRGRKKKDGGYSVLSMKSGE